MTTLSLDIPEAHRMGGSATLDLDRAKARPGGVPATLDEVVVGTWSMVAVGHSPPCLVCGGEVVPRYGAGPHPVAGSCRSCGTEMS